MKFRYYSGFIVYIFTFLFLHTGLAEAQNQTIGGDLTGEPLQEYLRENYTPNTTLGYNVARDRMYTILDNDDGYVIGVYTYYQVPVDPNSSTPRADAYQNGAGMNAEHLWPQSKGADSGPPNSDLHHLYASEIRVNNDRGNLRFGSIPDDEVDLWYNVSSVDDNGTIFTSTPPPEDERQNWSQRKNNDRFEAKLDRKGDIARAMFYFYTIYRNEADAEDANFFSTMDEDLVDWHSLDEVDDYEVWRSESISDWQGNVNPFVMDTTLIRRAYFMDDGGSDPDEGPELTEIFTESFGSVSSSTPIEEHSFDNDSFSFEGNGDIRESLPSEGYEKASGDGQVFMNLGYRYLTIENINTTGYEQIVLGYGVYSSSTTSFTIEYRTAGEETWTELSNNMPHASSTWTFLEIEDTGLPAAESLSLRFSKDNGQQYRLDDLHLSGVAEEATSTEGIADRPETVTLDQNYPNPFNPSTSIRYDLQENQQVKISVYDMLGREIAVLENGMKSAGAHEFNWDASNVSSGIYMYSLETGSNRVTRKMTLMK